MSKQTVRSENELIELIDERPGADVVRREVLEGLTAVPKTLPPKLLYDERGAQLFEEICEVDEYYLTRLELGLMRDHVDEMARQVGTHCRLVEYGSGAGVKTRLLIEHLVEPAGYVPIDIAKTQLAETATALSSEFPHLDVTPVCADFTSEFSLPIEPDPNERRVVYCPGSTIGNFHPAEARGLLRHAADVCGEGGGVLIGVDLLKSRAVLEQAYNDRDGVTAAFNLNLLRRINRELDADFDLSGFRHKAVFNEDAGRMEMHIESLVPQSVRVDDAVVEFEAGETIHTECSYKYRLDQFEDLAQSAGLDRQNVWTDSEGYFSVHFLTVES